MSHKKMELAKPFRAAQTRIASLQSIEEKLDLGNGFDLATFSGLSKKYQEGVDAYNTLLSQADGMRTELRETSRRLAEFNGRVLSAIAAKYGRDSKEYGMAGGTRTSERRKPRKSKKS